MTKRYAKEFVWVICFAAVAAICPTWSWGWDGSGAPHGTWRHSVPISPYSQYVGFALGLDGRVWAGDEIDKEFLVFDSWGKFTTISTGSFVPLWMTRGSDGNLYVSGSDQTILKVTPAGTQTTVSLGQRAGGGISAGPDGSVWVAEQSEVGRIYPGGKVREYPVETGDDVSYSTAITQAAGGDVWFDAETPGYSYYLASMNPNTGQIKKHFIDSCGSNEIWPMVAAADGRVWAMCDNYIDGFETEGGVTRVRFPANLNFAMVGGYDNAVAGPDNAIWIVGQNIVNGLDAGGAILRFDLVSHKFHKYVAPDGYEWASGLAFDAHGNVWAGCNDGEIQELILR